MRTYRKGWHIADGRMKSGCIVLHLILHPAALAYQNERKACNLEQLATTVVDNVANRKQLSSLSAVDGIGAEKVNVDCGPQHRFTLNLATG